jgi:hypothetical protein
MKGSGIGKDDQVRNRDALMKNRVRRSSSRPIFWWARRYGRPFSSRGGRRHQQKIVTGECRNPLTPAAADPQKARAA